MNKDKTEYENFEHTMRELMKVPHSEIKAKLDEEKAAKKKKKAKGRKVHDNSTKNVH
jgi:hypothetical protein